MPFQVTNWAKQRGQCDGTSTVQHIYFLPCSWMLSRIVILISQSETALMASYWQVKTKAQAGVLDELQLADDMDKNTNSKAKTQEATDQFYNHVITMTLQSAEERRRMYTNHRLESRTMNQPSL